RAADRHLLLRQEVADEVETAIVEHVGRDDVVTVLAQHTNNGAAAGGRLPDIGRELFGTNERRHRRRRGLVQVETPLGVCAPLDLCGVVEHWLTGDAGELAMRGRPRSPWAAASS